MKGLRFVLWIMATAVMAPGPAGAQAPPQPATPFPAVPPRQAAAALEPARIGVFDLERILAKSTSGVAAREQLEREKAAMQKEIDGKRQGIEKLRDELDKKGPLMTADARREKQDTFERKRRDAARLLDDFYKELEKKEQLLLQRVLREVTGVIDRVAREGRYLLIVEKLRGGVAYVAPSADLTDEIIRVYDQESAAKGKK